MGNKILFVLLAFCCPLWAQRSDPAANCGIAGSTSLGQNWTLDAGACVGQTADTTNSSTEAVTYAITSGHLYVSTVGSCDWESVSGGCSGGPFSKSALTVTDSSNALSVSGTVTVTGNTMTCTGGLCWGMQGCNWGSCVWAGKTITVNALSCTMTIPLSLTSATVSGCSTGSGLTFSGPAGLEACTDTSEAPGLQIAVCWGQATSTVGSDTITVHGASTSPAASLSIEFQGVSNTTGDYSLDAAGSNIANFGAQFQQMNLNNATTKQQMTLSTTGEIVFATGEFQTGPVYQVTGWDKLLMGSSGATHSDNSCDAGGYCTNQTQTEVQTFASSEAINPEINGAQNDEGLIQAVAFTSGTTAYAVPSGWVLTNMQCWKSSGTSYCAEGTGVMGGIPSTNPSVIALCYYWSSGTPSTPTIAGVTLHDSGASSVALSGAHVQCQYGLNTTNNTEVTPTFSTTPNWWSIQQYTYNKSSGSLAFDCFGSAANQTTGSGGSANSGACTTTANGDLALGQFGFSNGPPGTAGASFAWFDPISVPAGTGAAMEFGVQATAGSINPPAIDGNGLGDSYAGITMTFKAPGASIAVQHRGWMIQ